MQPDQPEDVDRASNLRGSSGYVHKSDSVQTKSARNRSAHTAPHTPHPEGSASALVRLAGICWASTRPVRPASPGVSTPPTRRHRHGAQKSQGCARTQRGGHFWRHSASLFLMAGRKTRSPHRRTHRKQRPETPRSGSQIGSFFPFCHWYNDPSSSQRDSGDYAQAQTNESPLLPLASFERTSVDHTTKKIRVHPPYYLLLALRFFCLWDMARQASSIYSPQIGSLTHVHRRPSPKSRSASVA